MAQPDVYTPAHSFVADSANIPDFPGQNLDVEFAEIAAVFAEYRTNIALLQNDDGTLKNGIVTAESLDTVLAAGLGDLSSLATVQALIASATASAAAALVSQTSASASAASATASAATATTQATTATTQATNAAASAVLAAASIGYRYIWSTNTASSDPGSGTIKGNNATVASITSLYLSETDVDSNALAALIADWGVSTSTNKAVVRISKTSAPSTVWAQFYVTAAVTDNGTWDTLTVTYKDGAGAFSNLDAVTLSAQLVGDKGATGTPGSGTLASMTTHGVLIATGATAATSLGVATDGQLVVGATGADPTLRTVSGDITLSATGVTAIKTSVSLTTPVLNVATATSINKVAITAPATSATLTIADGKTLTVDKSLEFDGTDSTKMTFPAVSANVLTDGNTATITKGFTVTKGVPTANTSFTVDPTKGNYQYFSTNTSYTITAYTALDHSVDYLIAHSTGTCTPTLTGFTVITANTATPPTSSTAKWILSIRCINGIATYSVYVIVA